MSKMDPNPGRRTRVFWFVMRIPIRAPMWVMLALPLGLEAQTSGTCATAFEAPATVGHEIAMNLRSGDIEIVGTSDPVIRVSCTMRNSWHGDEDASRIRISFAADHLTIRGGSHSNVRFR